MNIKFNKFKNIHNIVFAVAALNIVNVLYF